MLRIVVLLMGCLLSLISTAVERESSTVVRFAAGTVTPWVYLDDQGAEQGTLIEFSQALASHTDIAYTNILQPYPRALQSLASGYVDFAVAFESSSVGETAILVGGLSHSKVLMVARKGDAKRYGIPLQDGRRVGFIRGSDYDMRRGDRDSLNLFPLNNMHQGLEMLLKDRIDVMVGTEEAFGWSLTEMQLGVEELELVRVLGKANVGLYMSKKSPNRELLSVYRQALDKMRQDGSLEKIFRRHDQSAVEMLKQISAGQ